MTSAPCNKYPVVPSIVNAMKNFAMAEMPLLWLNNLIGDLSYGLRMMRNAPLVSIAVTLTLAVGIGINSGIFTIINGILLRPRADSDPATFARAEAMRGRVRVDIAAIPPRK